MTSSLFFFWVIDISGNDFIDFCVLDVILILDLVSSIYGVYKSFIMELICFPFLGDLAGFLEHILDMESY